MIDLHMHSLFSDGTMTPEELVEAGRREGLTAMALTDHDTVQGQDRFRAAAQAAGLRTLTGVEVSALSPRGSLHVLGYGVRHDDPALRDRLAWICAGREERNREIVARLNRLGLALTMEEVAAQAGSEVVGRPHFALAMIARGYVRTKREAFDRYLARGRPAHAERRRFEPEETIALIRAAGGLAVVAHPVTLGMGTSDLRNFLQRLADAGLAGLEAYYPEHTPQSVRLYERMARELGLLATGGSDFHGAVTPDLRLGRGFGSLHVPDEVFDRLAERLAA